MFTTSFKPARLLLAGIAMLYTVSASAQISLPIIAVDGTVLDAVSREPIPDAYLFVSNSLLSDSTDQEGAFAISGFGAGNFTFVVVASGYETVIDNLRLTYKGGDQSIQIYLKPSEGEAPSTRSASETTEDRKKHLSTFNEFFLGVSSNAKNCEIVNPEILRFERDPQKNAFKASADELLIVDNHALGYRLHMLLQQFEVYPSSRDRSIRYSILVGFTEMESDSKRDNRRWRRNRRDAYRGSERHFLTALTSNELADEGYALMKEGDLQTQQSSGIPGARANDRVPQVSPDQILSPGDFSHERVIDFEGYLKVVNLNDAPDDAYLDFKHHAADWEVPDADPLYQVSWITLTDGPVTITTDGRVESDYGITKLGYWFFHRVAELLPIEYRD